MTNIDTDKLDAARRMGAMCRSATAAEARESCYAQAVGMYGRVDQPDWALARLSEDMVRFYGERGDLIRAGHYAGLAAHYCGLAGLSKLRVDMLMICDEALEATARPRARRSNIFSFSGPRAR